jgi:glutaredoxin
MNVRKALACVLCLSLSTSSKAENLSTGENVDAFVERHIASAHVVVFAKTYCHYCANTKRVLGDLHEKSKDGWAAGARWSDHTNGALDQNWSKDRSEHFHWRQTRGWKLRLGRVAAVG